MALFFTVPPPSAVVKWIMGRSLKHHTDFRSDDETGAVRHSWKEGRYRVALVYPNTYHQGMSNLGVQTVYRLINAREDSLCERFFLPDPAARQQNAPLLSVESQRPLRDFDLIALSVSFENDYLNLPALFAAAAIPLYAWQRGDNDPLVVFGGVCAFLNPEPLAEIVDLVAVGEAEPLLDGLLTGLQAPVARRDQLLAQLAQLPGIYVPVFYQPEYDDRGATFSVQHGFPKRIVRQYLANLDDSPSRNFIRTPATEFGHMALIEASRGCARACRFCAAGFIYRPFRERSLGNLLGQIDEDLCQCDRIGLVAAAVADHSGFDRIQQHIIARGGELSVSSLRLDAITPAHVDRLHQAGHTSVAIAPEAGSQRLRDVINKGLSTEQIFTAAHALAAGGIRNLKMYFLIGLPTEGPADLEAIIDLTASLAGIWKDVGSARGQLGKVTISVNPFIPKPFTPLQWAAMTPEKELKKKVRRLQAAIARIPNTRLLVESPRLAVMQGLLSRGDRRVGRLLPQLAAGANLKHLCAAESYPLEATLFQKRRADECFAWEIIDQGFGRGYLRQEYERALSTAGEISD